MIEQYTIKDLLEMRVNGEKLITIADIQENCGDCSDTHAYNIINGKAVIFTNEIRRLARWIRERGLTDFTEDNIDWTGLGIKYYPYT